MSEPKLEGGEFTPELDDEPASAEDQAAMLSLFTLSLWREPVAADYLVPDYDTLINGNRPPSYIPSFGKP